MTGWIGVDLDGTLVHNDENGKFTPLDIGAPVPAMVARVKDWLSEGKDVRIVTARVASNVPNRERIINAIEEWSKQYLGQIVPVTSEKDHNMAVLYDDRAKEVIPNTGIVKVYAKDGSDVPSYVPKDKRRQWAAVWNSVHQRGGDEASAFAQANGVAGPKSEKTMSLKSMIEQIEKAESSSLLEVLKQIVKYSSSQAREERGRFYPNELMHAGTKLRGHAGGPVAAESKAKTTNVK